MSSKSGGELTVEAKYEFRVWGKHRKALRVLNRLGTLESNERFEDCYLLGSDPEWNAKVRGSKFKLKRLIDQRRGFDRWDSRWHETIKTVPSAFESTFEDLSLDRPQRGKDYSIAKAVEGLDDNDDTWAVFVTKDRRRYRIGAARVEVVDIEVQDSSITLKSLAIEGDDLAELVKVRRQLGLKGEENVAVHVALENETLAAAGRS